LLKLESLKSELHKKGLSRTDKLLLILAAGAGAQKLDAIRKLAATAGLRGTSKWNITDCLRKSKGKAINTPDGWELTEAGRKHLSDTLGVNLNESPMSIVASGVRKHLDKIANPQTKTFVEEAVDCLERGNRRAAVVLSWVGAVSVLQEHIVTHNLAAFNAEAASRPKLKWSAASTTDDLSRLDEYEFLQICAAISVVGKSVKQRLEQALKLRNGAGHPNSLTIGEFDASAHVEALMHNVFQRF
jgi:hypothetical protein